MFLFLVNIFLFIILQDRVFQSTFLILVFEDTSVIFLSCPQMSLFTVRSLSAQLFLGGSGLLGPHGHDSQSRAGLCVTGGLSALRLDSCASADLQPGVPAGMLGADRAREDTERTSLFLSASLDDVTAATYYLWL